MAARPVLARRGSRQLAALAVAVGSVAVACGGSSAPPAGSAARLIRGTTQVSLVQAQSALPPGHSRFVFGLVPRDGEPLAGGDVEVWVASSERSVATGPIRARWVRWSARLEDRLGAPPIPGFYVADIDVPRPGSWVIVARTRRGSRTISATAAMPVDAQAPAQVGSKAIVESTPVAATPAEAAAIDSREPPTPMHYISLDRAVGNGLPTVLVFATPLLCQSRMCGPVVDEVLHVYDSVSAARANFVDVEIYPERDTNKPAPAFLRWGFQSEPWVLVIDRDGIIRGRFEGPVTGPEVQAALQPLLAK